MVVSEKRLHQETPRVQGRKQVPVWRAGGSKRVGRSGKLVSQPGSSLSGLDYQGSSRSPSNAPTGTLVALRRDPRTLGVEEGTLLPESWVSKKD